MKKLTYLLLTSIICTAFEYELCVDVIDNRYTPPTVSQAIMHKESCAPTHAIIGELKKRYGIGSIALYFDSQLIPHTSYDAKLKFTLNKVIISGRQRTVTTPERITATIK